MPAHKHRGEIREILNNDKLIEQIRLCMIGDFHQKLFDDFPNGLGEIEYDVRGGATSKEYTNTSTKPTG